MKYTILRVETVSKAMEYAKLKGAWVVAEVGIPMYFGITTGVSAIYSLIPKRLYVVVIQYVTHDDPEFSNMDLLTDETVPQNIFGEFSKKSAAEYIKKFIIPCNLLDRS